MTENDYREATTPQITCEDLIYAGQDDAISDLFEAAIASIENGLRPDLVQAVIQHAILKANR